MNKLFRPICWLRKHPVIDPDGHYVTISDQISKRTKVMRLGQPAVAVCKRCGMKRLLHEGNYKGVVAK